MQIFILQTVGGFSSTGESGGGVLYAIGLAEEWAATGHEVHFVSNSQDKFNNPSRPTFSFYRIPALRVGLDSSPLSFLVGAIFNHAIQWRFLKSLVSEKRLRHSIIITASPYPSDVVAALRLSRALKMPAAVYFHHLNPPPWWHPLKRGNLFRVAINWTLTLFALSLAKLGGLTPVLGQPHQLNKAGWKFQDSMASQYFLNLELESEPGPRQPTYDASFIGRIAPNKGIIDLLRTWRIVTDAEPNAKLVIAGKASSKRFENLLRRHLKHMGLLNSVEYRGYVPAGEKRKLLAQSRLFVYPSYEEGWSLGVMEAAYRGVVPILYNLPAYEYLTCAEIKVPVGDVRAMAKLVIGLLRDEKRTSLIANRLKSTVSGYRRQTIARTQIVKFGLLRQERDCV